MSIVTDQTLLTIAPEKRLQLSKERSLEGIRPDLHTRLVELVKGSRPWPLYLYGPAGTGKTCAALTMCDHAVSAVYFSVDVLCDRIMQGEVELFEWIASKDLAVLDEIGARERVGELHYSAVKRFADARDGKPTIYISNLEPKEPLANIYDDRIRSRLACGTWFFLDGDDRRLER